MKKTKYEKATTEQLLDGASIGFNQLSRIFSELVKREKEFKVQSKREYFQEKLFFSSTPSDTFIQYDIMKDFIKKYSG